jgi:acetoin:2,6-dichlorophenolindophenol oxidoreductase subunit beta
MREISFRDALHEALVEELERDPTLLIMGEDIIPQGGSFGVHKDLDTRFPGRILQTPISEAGFVGAAIGAAMTGGPVVVEIMFADFLTCCMDEIVNQAAKLRYMTGGQASVPLVVRAPCGMGRGTAAQHTQALEAWFAHVPGLQVVVPSTPSDAKGLLKTAIRTPDPVVFLEYKLLYATTGPVPEGRDHLVPFGSARRVREGADVTIVATGAMVPKCLEAVDLLASDGLAAELIDPRTVSPIDFATIFASVEKTGRLLVVDESVRLCSVASEIAATVAEERFAFLRAPIRRLCAPHVPKPFTPVLEALVLPGVDDIAEAAFDLARPAAVP